MNITALIPSKNGESFFRDYPLLITREFFFCLLSHTFFEESIKKCIYALICKCQSDDIQVTNFAMLNFFFFLRIIGVVG